MTPEEIGMANRKSALEQEEQDERNENLKACMKAEFQLNRRSSHPYTFIGEVDRKAEALQEIERENVEASQNK